MGAEKERRSRVSLIVKVDRQEEVNSMNTSHLIKLGRDCEAIQIPSGERILLKEGTLVNIAQSLGGTYTVTTEDGYMVRIAGKDADALGFESSGTLTSQAVPTDQESMKKMVWGELKTCYDPEIPIDIVELGLIYDCQVQPIEEGGYRVDIKMTLTAPGCGMGSILSTDVENRVMGVPGVKSAKVELVWDPPWNPNRMSEAARLHLGLM